MNQEKDESYCEEWRFGWKKTYAIIDGDTVTIAVDCDVFNEENTCLKITITTTQWERLKRKDGLVQDILPDYPASVREVFISGKTPCEFIESFGGTRLTQSEMRALGYAIDEDALPDDEHFAEWRSEDPLNDDN